MVNGMKGSGLGLAIANSLVELHGGRSASSPGPTGARRRWSPCRGSNGIAPGRVGARRLTEPKTGRPLAGGERGLNRHRR